VERGVKFVRASLSVTLRVACGIRPWEMWHVLVAWACMFYPFWNSRVPDASLADGIGVPTLFSAMDMPDFRSLFHSSNSVPSSVYPLVPSPLHNLCLTCQSTPTISTSITGKIHRAICPRSFLRDIIHSFIHTSIHYNCYITHSCK
jgi:hypothetical protein